MYIESVSVERFRCFEAIRFDPGSGFNAIVGDNATGKTSLLEAIFFLGRGQSFRQGSARSVVRRNESGFLLSGRIRDSNARAQRVAVQQAGRHIKYRLAGHREVTRLDLVNALPLQLVDPGVHRLLEQGPRYRRRFLDWGVFHVEHAFYSAWRRYRRALRQRNIALKARWRKKDIIAWDSELVANAEIIDSSRRAYIAALGEKLPDRLLVLLGDERVALRYMPGWRGDTGFGAALAAGLEQDARAGFTRQGPHRADFRVQVGGNDARDWVSRGQQKVLTSAMLLVQADLLFERRGVRPVLLIDDLAAELGEHYRTALIDQIRAFGGQSFVTFLKSELVPPDLETACLFHVEHGQVVIRR